MLSSLKCGLALVAGVVAFTGVAADVRAEVIFSNYGPGMSYSTAAGSPGAGGPLASYFGWYTGHGDERAISLYASFVTPAGSNWLPTKAFSSALEMVTTWAPS